MENVVDTIIFYYCITLLFLFIFSGNNTFNIPSYTKRKHIACCSIRKLLRRVQILSLWLYTIASLQYVYTLYTYYMLY